MGTTDEITRRWDRILEDISDATQGSYPWEVRFDLVANQAFGDEVLDEGMASWAAQKFDSGQPYESVDFLSCVLFLAGPESIKILIPLIPHKIVPATLAHLVNYFPIRTADFYLEDRWSELAQTGKELDFDAYAQSENVLEPLEVCSFLSTISDAEGAAEFFRKLIGFYPETNTYWTHIFGKYWRMERDVWIRKPYDRLSSTHESDQLLSDLRAKGIYIEV